MTSILPCAIYRLASSFTFSVRTQKLMIPFIVSI